MKSAELSPAFYDGFVPYFMSKGARGVVGTVEDLVPILIGQDPRDITRALELLVRTAFWPLGVIGLTAVSAIEQALWDIKGKDLGQPVWALLGGKVRDRVRVATEEAGTNYFISQFSFGDLSQEEVLHSISQFAREMMPGAHERVARAV